MVLERGVEDATLGALFQPHRVPVPALEYRVIFAARRVRYGDQDGSSQVRDVDDPGTGGEAHRHGTRHTDLPALGARLVTLSTDTTRMLFYCLLQMPLCSIVWLVTCVCSGGGRGDLGELVGIHSGGQGDDIEHVPVFGIDLVTRTCICVFVCVCVCGCLQVRVKVFRKIARELLIGEDGRVGGT